MFDATAERVAARMSAAEYRRSPVWEKLDLIGRADAYGRHLEEQALDMIVQELRAGVQADEALLWVCRVTGAVREYRTLDEFARDHPRDTRAALRRLDDGSSSLYGLRRAP